MSNGIIESEMSSQYSVTKCMWLQTDPNPKDPRIQKSIFSSNASYVRRPRERGKVIVREQVDAYGRRSSEVKLILGVSSNPVAGSLPAPEKNCRTFERETDLFPEE